MYRFVEIIEGIVDNFLKASGDILGITEITPGVYEIESNKLDDLLLNDQVVSITNTSGFNGKYVVSNINRTLMTFTISAGDGILIPGVFGEWVSLAVHFEDKNIPEYSEFLSNELISDMVDRKRFPSLFLVVPYRDREQIRNYSYKISFARFYILMNTEPSKSMEWRKQNTLPYLRLIRERFIEGLGSSSQLIGLLTVDGEEIPHWDAPDQNKLNTPVDAIQLDLTDFEIINKNLCDE